MDMVYLHGQMEENFFSNKAFEGMWITKQEYEEEGATVVNKKFQ